MAGFDLSAEDSHGDGAIHWSLAHVETGAVVDPGGPQRGGKRLPYKDGRRATFSTAKPSRRAAELMGRVRAASAK